MRTSIIVVLILSTVLALSVSTAMAKDNSANKGSNQGDGPHKKHKKGHHKAAKKGSGNNGGANRGSGNGGVPIADRATLTSNQASNRVNSEDSAQEDSFAFKGTLTQDGTQDSPLQVRVEKANGAGKSFVGKDVTFNVSSNTEIYRDDPDGQDSNLDAQLSDLKAQDEVMIQAKGARNASSFTANVISAEPPTTDTASASNTVATPATP